MIVAQPSPVLLASCWTIGGNICPGTANNISAFRLEDRIEAAATAGYTGIGLWHGDLLHAWNA